MESFSHRVKSSGLLTGDMLQWKLSAGDFSHAILVVVMDRRTFLAASLAASLTGAARAETAIARRLYVVCPGIRDYLEFGGAGILVFDIDNGHKFIKRIATDASSVAKPRNIKGVVANPATRKLHFTTPESLYCVDLLTEKTEWGKELPQGCDRLAATPDGKTLFVPSFEKDIWNVVDAISGKVVSNIETKSGAHNTICGLAGTRAYLAGLKSPFLFAADTSTHKVIDKTGPFAASIRPFTVNGAETLCFVNVNELLGFEVGDLKTGKKLHRVEVPEFKKGMVKRHGCPSHGIGLTPDEKEVWVVDAFNERVHIFDATVMPPKYIASIQLREQPGWVTFSLDGKYAYPSTGEVIDTATKKIVTALADEGGGPVHSEKMVEIHFKSDVPVVAGDQFGLGRKK
jgi:DNA-binding beta-propeller fold protein YncE